MRGDDDIYIIIPCYNEQQRIATTVKELLHGGYRHIIVVDDGSVHDIYSEIKTMPVVYIRHAFNLGQGAALQTGLAYARSQHAAIAISFDADGQHRVSDVPALCAPLLRGEADIVLGSRFIGKGQPGIPFFRKLTLQQARFINFLFCGLLLTDAHNGLRALGKKALEKITITENRMAHASEILFEIKDHRLRFVEVPVSIAYTAYSKQKGQKGHDSIKTLFDLVLNKLFK